MKLLKQCICISMLGLLFCFWINSAIAKPYSADVAINNNTISDADTQQFDTLAANQILNQLKLDLNSQDIPLKSLQTAVSVLNKFQLQAKKCIVVDTAALEQLNHRLAEITAIALPPQTKNIALSQEQTYLDNKKILLNAHLSECRLFSLKTDEFNATLGKKLHEIIANQLFYAYPTIWKNLENLSTKTQDFYKTFDMGLFKQESGIGFFSQAKNSQFYSLFFCLMGIVFYTLRIIKKKQTAFSTQIPKSFLSKIKQALIAALGKNLLLLVIGLLLVIFFSITSPSLLAPSYLALTSYNFLIYAILSTTLRFLFYLSQRQTLIHLPLSVGRILLKQLHTFGLLYFIIYTIYIFSRHQIIDTTLIHLFKTAVITCVATNVIASIWVIKDFLKLSKYHSSLYSFNSFILIIVLLFILVGEYLGYHTLALYLIYGITMTVIVILIKRLIDKLINLGFDVLKSNEHYWQKKFHANFGLEQNEKLIELLWLRALIHLVIWIGFFMSMLKIWGLGQINFQVLLNTLNYGFDIGTFHLVPSRLISGTFLFIVLALLNRWLKTRIVKNEDWQLEHSSLESLASIVGYMGFAIAFMIGALIAGVNFSGLAIVAGALSVGIGFGLQNIVNNFVSGIILLIERPIKSGDRIIVGDTEGYVKKISIRSTHLITTKLSDVIVPNSELVSKQVTNYMLYDMEYKVLISLGIAYGSDTELAYKTLLDIAFAHPEVVIHKKDIEPAVYFTAFGDNSLSFELHCVVKDINLKYRVASDLNFAIEKIFKEKNIQIAFPQLDLHIMRWPTHPQETLLADKEIIT